MIDRTRPPDVTFTFGRPAIGEARPDPLHLQGGISMSDPMVKVADKDGIYMVGDSPMRFKKGDPIPFNAEYRDAGEERKPSPRQQEREAIAKATEQAAKDAAKAESRAKGAAPENR
jgi:hypothetical protein